MKVFFLLATAMFYFTGINAQTTKVKPIKAMSDTVYQCPMKCEGEKTYNKAGKCPVCNMNLKAKVTPVAAKQYQCPMKCEGEKMYSKEGKCPVCNMALKKIKPAKEKNSQATHHH